MIKSVSLQLLELLTCKSIKCDDLLKGKSSKPSEAGVGSGVIYQINNNSAYIVTNNHVIDGANEIRVQLHNKNKLKRN